MRGFTEANFNEMWECRPTKRGSVMVLEKGEYVSKPIYRYFKSYLTQVPVQENTGKSYMFGDSQPDEDWVPLPIPFERFEGMYDCNQCTINWYCKGVDYIEPHGDCTYMWAGDHVYVINLLRDAGSVIPFDIYNKDKTEIISSIDMKHGDVIRMDRQFQIDYRHGVGKPPCDRISLSLRKVFEV